MSLSDNLLKVYRENKIDQCLRESDSLEMLYHLSPMRKNLLEWYDFKADATLLEVGAGAGALTGMFAQKVAKVIALDKDASLLAVNKEIHGDCSHISYVSGKIDAVGEEKFDYITLIGTLEEAHNYCDGKNPYIALIEQCKNFLKPEGVLILAGDNKTGMKYWAGAPEVASESVFSGITNDSNAGKKRSFSKPQYETMLAKNGFLDVEFYYPTPDYRFVSSLYSDEFLPQAGELRTGNGVYQRGGYQFFEEELAYDTVCEDGMYSYFADAFLIFAKNCNEVE